MLRWNGAFFDNNLHHIFEKLALFQINDNTACEFNISE